MPFVELIAPSFKNSPASKASLQSLWITASPTFQNNPGIRCGFIGRIVSKNGQRVVEDAPSLIYLLEWKSLNAFEAFSSSADFLDFIRNLTPLLTRPAKPQLFQTDKTPWAFAKAPVTETIQLRSDVPETVRMRGWRMFVQALQHTRSQPDVRTLQGNTINARGKGWVGILGWDSLETRNRAYGVAAVRIAFDDLCRGEAPEVLVMKVEPLIQPKEGKF